VHTDLYLILFLLPAYVDYPTDSMIVFQCNFQRTERVPTDSNIAQSNPEKFAQMLCEKLQRFKDEQDKFERITTSLHRIDVSPYSNLI